MITVSDRAAQKIRTLATESSSVAEPSIRVSVVSGGCSGLSYKLDFAAEPNPGDEQFTDKGIAIVCDKKSFFYLIGTELDFSDGLNGKGFQFINPNASRTCGCGESFSL
jgi:iron-sulfur cluster assembly protein